MANLKLERRHFQFIAETIKEEIESAIVNLPDGNISSTGIRITGLKDLAKSFADRLRSTNSNFKRERFLTACGVE